MVVKTPNVSLIIRGAICVLSVGIGLFGAEIALPSGQRVVLGAGESCARTETCGKCISSSGSFTGCYLNSSGPTLSCEDYDNDGVKHCVPYIVKHYRCYAEGMPYPTQTKTLCVQSGQPQQTVCQ
jgi:hypothetical protein